MGPHFHPERGSKVEGINPGGWVIGPLMMNNPSQTYISCPELRDNPRTAFLMYPHSFAERAWFGERKSDGSPGRIDRICPAANLPSGITVFPMRINDGPRTFSPTLG